MNELTKNDIDIALEANKNTICIQIAVSATSPHEDFTYMSNPCVINTLVNMGWTLHG